MFILPNCLIRWNQVGEFVRMNSIDERDYKGFQIIVGSLYALLSMIMIFGGKHHVDEGYYHLIAALSAKGAMPYRDYLYVQTPLFPCLYGLLFKITGNGFIAGRSISAAFGMISLFLTGMTVRKIGGDRPGIAATALIIAQPFTIYYLTIIKLYAVTAFLVTGACSILLLVNNRTVRYALSASILAIATAFRFTIVAGLITVLCIVILRTRRIFAIAVVLGSGLITLGITFFPFYLTSKDVFIYDVFTYHLDKESFSLFRQLFHRIGSLSELSQLYFLIMIILTTGLVTRLVQKVKKQQLLDPWPEGLIDSGWVILGIVLFHFTSQAPYVYRYLTVVVPAVCMLAGYEAGLIEKMLNRLSRLSVPWGSIFCLMCLITMIGRGSADLGNIRAGGPVLELQKIADQIKILTPADKPILTFNNSVAVVADRSVVPGDEMNVLTYDPAWTIARCKKFSVLNLEMLKNYLDSKAFGAVLVTRYSFIGNFPTFYNPGEIGARPMIMDALNANYVLLRKFPRFGYLGEDAQLYLPRQTSREN